MMNLRAATSPADVCFVCGTALGETIYLVPDQVSGERRQVCAGCVALPQVCYLCGVPVKRELTELADGRVLCARDAKSVVLDEETARRLCRETREAMDRQFARFISFPETNLTLKMADRVSLLEFFRTPGHDVQCPNVLGYVQTRTNRGVIQHEMSLLTGLQPGILRATYAHECTHAWLAEHLTPKRAERLTGDALEGFCELVAYLTLGALGDAQTQQAILKNQYTRGQVSLLIEAEQRFGFNEVVEWIKQGEDNRLRAGEVERIRVLSQSDTAGVATGKAPAVPALTPVSQVGAPTNYSIVLQGITWAGQRSTAAINNRNFACGEEAAVSVGGTNLTIRCLEIRPDAVLIQRAGAKTTEELRWALPR
jgi:hypothetical protein